MNSPPSIQEHVEKVASWNPATVAPSVGFPYIDLSSVDQEEKVIAEVRTVVGADAPSRARQLVEAGDVLVSTVRPNLNGVARVPTCLDGATASTGFTVLRANERTLSGAYLFHWVKTPQFVDDMVRKATGASYPAVSDRIVCASKIPLPPMERQRRIAAILDRAEALRAKRREALAKLDSLTESLFLEMFGDPATNPRNWTIYRFGDIAVKFSDGPFGSNLKSEHYTDRGVRVVRLQNIGVGDFLDSDRAYISEVHAKSLSKHECKPGDVLVGTLGDPNLRACVQPSWLERAINKADCVQVRPNPEIATPDFVAALLNIPSTEKMASGLIHGQTRSRIAMGRLRELNVPVPPLRLQDNFSNLVRSQRMQRDNLFASITALETLASSLQSRAFRGEL